MGALLHALVSLGNLGGDLGPRSGTVLRVGGPAGQARGEHSGEHAEEGHRPIRRGVCGERQHGGEMSTSEKAKASRRGIDCRAV